MGRQSYKQKWRTFATYLSYKHLGDRWLQQVLEGKENVNARHPMICNGATALDIVLLKASDRDPRALQLLDRILALGADPQLCDVWCHLLECPISSNFDAFPYVQKLLAVGVHPDKRGRKARTALHFLFNGYQRRVPELLELFLAHGASINERDVAGRTPLRFYLKKKTCKDASLLQRLLDAGADANVADIYNDTPLHVFCGYQGAYADVLEEEEYAQWMEILLKGNANPFLRGSQNRNVLDLVVAAGHAKTLQVLLDNTTAVAGQTDGSNLRSNWSVNDGLEDAVAAFIPRICNWGAFTEGGCSSKNLEREMFVRQVHVIELLLHNGATLSETKRTQLLTNANKVAGPADDDLYSGVLSLVVERQGWTPATHPLFPKPFRLAVATLLTAANYHFQRSSGLCNMPTTADAKISNPRDSDSVPDVKEARTNAAMCLAAVNDDVLLRIVSGMAYPLTAWLTADQ